MCGEAARSAARREGEDRVIAEKWSGCCGEQTPELQQQGNVE